jgi:hypothetical protein
MKGLALVVRPELEPELPAFRFSLRHMFLAVTLASVVLAVVAGGIGAGFAPLATLLFAAVIVLHVAGTAIGTRLRQHADDRQAWEAGRGEPQEPTPLPFVRPTTLCRHDGLPRPWVPGWIAVGLALGGIAGAALLLSTIGHRTTPLGVAVGAISTAIVGGWVAFVAASFWAIVREGWRDAARES